MRKTAKAMMKLLIRRPRSRRGAAAPALAADGAARGRKALQQTALTLPFGRASPAKPTLARLPLVSAAIITQLRASLDQDFAASTAVGALWAARRPRLPGHAWCDRCN
jgi:hypothetical protein